MINDILLAFWFFLPAGLANASPVFFNKIPYFNRWGTPLDFGKKYRGKRVFGDNKKLRGLVGGIIIASLTVAVQYYLHKNSASVRSLIPYDYCNAKILWLGPLLGFGALMGDAVESFFKRRAHKKPGERWFPFDQLDYIVGGLLLSLMVVRLTAVQYLFIVTMWFVMHLVASYTGYLLKLKDKPI